MYHSSLLHIDAASAPGSHSSEYCMDITCDVIAIGGGRVDGNDLLDGAAGMPDNRNGDLSLHIAVQNQLIPITIAFFPTGIRAKAKLTGIASRAANIAE